MVTQKKYLKYFPASHENMAWQQKAEKNYLINAEKIIIFPFVVFLHHHCKLWSISSKIIPVCVIARMAGFLGV